MADVNKFWDNFYDLALKTGIQETTARWYVIWVRTRHFSILTEKSYINWIRRFIIFHDMRQPQEMSGPEIRVYLEYLAETRRVAGATQKQALNALVFLYDQVLKKQPCDFSDYTKSKRPKRLPVVLTREEVKRLLNELKGVHWLLAGLLYGAGLRPTECLRLRIKDIDFEKGQITVRDGKGGKSLFEADPAEGNDPPLPSTSNQLPRNHRMPAPRKHPARPFVSIQIRPEVETGFV